jgi:sulfur-oxidizing protein SoxY
MNAVLPALRAVALLRRQWMKWGSATMLASVSGLAGGLLMPLRGWAATGRAGFDSHSLTTALQQLGATAALHSDAIDIQAPDVAEDGAYVSITVTSRIEGTRAISVLVDKNRYPLIATFRFGPGVQTSVSTRIKMGETSKLRAVVEANGVFYTAASSVLVTLGGCG